MALSRKGTKASRSKKNQATFPGFMRKKVKPAGVAIAKTIKKSSQGRKKVDGSCYKAIDRASALLQRQKAAAARAVAERRAVDAVIDRAVHDTLVKSSRNAKRWRWNATMRTFKRNKWMWLPQRFRDDQGTPYGELPGMSSVFEHRSHLPFLFE